MPSPPGIYTVAGHGDLYAFYDKDLNKIPPNELAKMIKRKPGYRTGQTVQLFSCRVGVEEHGYAQQLANELKAKVIAADNYVWIYPSGNTVVAPYLGPKSNNTPDLSNKGKWLHFHPNGL